MSRLTELLKSKALAANPANLANPERPISSPSKISSGHSAGTALPAHLEHRIRKMAARWNYTPDELTEVLSLAANDSVAWAIAVAHDEHRFGSGWSRVLQ